MISSLHEKKVTKPAQVFIQILNLISSKIIEIKSQYFCQLIYISYNSEDYNIQKRHFLKHKQEKDECLI